MSRRLVAIACSALLVLLIAAPGVALAAKPDRGCAAAPSGFKHVDREGWWAASVIGFGEAGISVYVPGTTTYTAAFDQFAVDFGFASGAELKAFILGEQWDGLDANDNDFVCMKDVPNTKGSPGYIFNGIDDTANAGH